MAKRGTIQYTDIEAKTAEALDAAGVNYEPQFPTRTGFVVDFAIVGRKIAIEVDGPHHDEPGRRSKDSFRTKRLKAEGWTVHRIHWSSLQDDTDRLLSLLVD